MNNHLFLIAGFALWVLIQAIQTIAAGKQL